MGLEKDALVMGAPKSISDKSFCLTDRRTDRQTDRQTDRRTDRRTDGRTDKPASLPAAGAARRQLNDGTHDGWYHVPITSPGHVLSISKSFLERFFQKSSFLVCFLWLLRHVRQICIKLLFFTISP